MKSCSFKQVLPQNLCWFLGWKTRFFRVFIFKANRKSIDSSKIGTRDFQNSRLFERSACFYVIITGYFERFQYFNVSQKLEYHF